MALPLPYKIGADPLFRPLLAIAENLLMKTNEVAAHLRFKPTHLHGMRRTEGAGPAFVQLPSGAVRYRMSEVMEWEWLGNSKHLTVERVILAAATMPDVTPEFLARLEAHLKSVLYVKR